MAVKVATYKVLGQAATTQSTLSITTKALTSNVATLTTSAVHSLVVGQSVSVIMTTADAAFDGVRVVVATPTTTTFTFESINTNVSSVAATGAVTGFEWITLYTCPALTSMVSSSLIVLNRGTTAGYYSIAVTNALSEPAVSRLIVKNDLAAARETVSLTLGLTADETNKYIRVCASNANFTFALFGSEIA